MTLRNQLIRNLIVSQVLMMLIGFVFMVGAFFDSQDGMQRAIVKSESTPFIAMMHEDPQHEAIVGPTISAYFDHRQLPIELQQVVPLGGTGFFEVDIDLEGLGIIDEREMLVYAIDVGMDGRILYVVSDTDVDQADKSLLIQIVYLLAIYVAVTLAIGAWWSWFSIRRVSAPMEKIGAQLRASTADSPMTDLSELYDQGEIGELAKTLDDKNRRIAQFIEREHNIMRNISHEFRTPITVIKSSIGLMKSANGKAQPAALAEKQLSKIERANQELTSLIDAFLWLGRERTSFEGSTDATACVEKAIVEHHHLLEGKSVALDVSMPRQIQIDCKETIFYVCAANLLRNAFSYTESGTIKIELSDSHFLVEDDGPGLASDPGQQQVKGFGLGLNIVNQICERMGWTWQLENKYEGHGSRAILTFK